MFVFKEKHWPAEHFPFAWFGFTLANCQARQNPSTKSHVGAVAQSLVAEVTWFLRAEEGGGFV